MEHKEIISQSKTGNTTPINTVTMDISNTLISVCSSIVVLK